MIVVWVLHDLVACALTPLLRLTSLLGLVLLEMCTVELRMS
jgi:hypothetical protein